MEIIRLDESRKSEYTQFVSSQKLNTFLQAWSWGDWQESQGKIVHRYFFVKNEQVVGSAQIILMRTPLGNYLYCPYGPLWQTDDTGKVNEEIVRDTLSGLKKVLRKEKVFFLRIEPIQKISFQDFGLIKAESVQPPQTLIKNILETDGELLKSFHPKTRYNIKVAQKNGVEIKTFSEVNEQVIDLIMNTSERQNYRNHNKGYIEKLWKFFANSKNNISSDIKVIGYLALKDEVAIASGLMVDFAKTRMYLFGGSNYEQRQFMGPYLMHWQAILDAKANGLSSYDFGAAENASGHTGGYMRFKMGFNPEIINFSGTHDLIFKPSVYSIYRSLRKVNRLILHLPFRK